MNVCLCCRQAGCPTRVSVWKPKRRAVFERERRGGYEHCFTGVRGADGNGPGESVTPSLSLWLGSARGLSSGVICAPVGLPGRIRPGRVRSGQCAWSGQARKCDPSLPIGELRLTGVLTECPLRRCLAVLRSVADSDASASRLDGEEKCELHRMMLVHAW